MESFVEYYNKQFGRDLRQWFKIEGESYGKYKCDFIPYARETGVARPMKCSDSTFHEYCFSISCFYTFLIPQIVSKVTNDGDGKLLFSKASGWPILSCGLGGIMSPAQVLYEAKIDPVPSERKKYYPMLLEQLPFFQREVKEFLQGNAPNLNGDAYKHLCALTDKRIEAILNEMEGEVNRYVSFLKGEKDSFDLYLLEQELR